MGLFSMVWTTIPSWPNSSRKDPPIIHETECFSSILDGFPQDQYLGPNHYTVIRHSNYAWSAEANSSGSGNRSWILSERHGDSDPVTLLKCWKFPWYKRKWCAKCRGKVGYVRKCLCSRKHSLQNTINNSNRSNALKTKNINLQREYKTMREINLTPEPRMPSGYPEVETLFIAWNRVRGLTLNCPF